MQNKEYLLLTDCVSSEKKDQNQDLKKLSLLVDNQA